MEGQAQLIVIAYGDDISFDPGHDLHSLAHALDIRSADEFHRHDTLSLEALLGIETAQLTAIGIAPHRHWQGAEIDVRVIAEPVSYTHLEVYKRQEQGEHCLDKTIDQLIADLGHCL